MFSGAGIGSAIGAGLGGLLGGYKNPAQAGDRFMGQMPGQINKYFDPYIQAGQRQGQGLENEYSRMINDPGGRMNQIGQGYHESPGFQFALQQAQQGAGHAAAAGGMAGSPQHEQQSMGIATGLANQDYNQWLQNALGMHTQGLQGSQGMWDTGANAGMRAGENMASILANRAQMAYEGQNSQNQRNGGIWGSIGGGLGALAGGGFF